VDMEFLIHIWENLLRGLNGINAPGQWSDKNDETYITLNEAYLPAGTSSYTRPHPMAPPAC